MQYIQQSIYSKFLQFRCIVVNNDAIKSSILSDEAEAIYCSNKQPFRTRYLLIQCEQNAMFLVHKVRHNILKVSKAVVANNCMHVVFFLIGM